MDVPERWWAVCFFDSGKPMSKVFYSSFMVATALLTTTAQADWTQFKGNAAHTGFAPGHFAPESFVPLWDVSANQLTGLATQGDALYFSERTTDGVFVRKLDRFSGAETWSHNVPSPYGSNTSAPTVYGDMVYIHRWGHSGSSGSTTPEHKPAVIGLDSSTGDRAFMTLHSGQWSSGSQPTVVDGGVFAAGGYYGGLDAYAHDGTKSWFANLPQQYGWIPSADESKVYSYMGRAGASPGPSTGTLFIVDQVSGNVNTISHPESTGTMSRSRDEGTVVLNGAGQAFALSGVSNGKALVAFDLTSESIAWQTVGSWTQNPVLSGSSIIVPEGGVLGVLDQASGNRVDTIDPEIGAIVDLVSTADYLFVSSSTTTRAFSLQSNQWVWETDHGGILAADDGVLYISDSDGVFAFTALPEPGAAAVFMLAGSFMLTRRRNRQSPLTTATRRDQ